MPPRWVIWFGVIIVALALSGLALQFYRHGVSVLGIDIDRDQLIKLIKINNKIIDYLNKNRDKWSTCRDAGRIWKEQFGIEAGNEYNKYTEALTQYYNDRVNQMLEITTRRQLRRKLSETEKDKIILALQEATDNLS